MRILVTGANGYLGQGIVRHILDTSCADNNDNNSNCNNSVIEVVATDITTDHVDNRAERINCDLFTVENPFNYFDQPDVLLHLAWRDGFVHYSDKHIDDLPRHYAFIKKMTEAEGLRLVACMGSMHEIGFWEGAIKADTPCNPTTPYGISKNALRQLTAMLCKQKNKAFLWLRGFYIVGNSQYGSSIFSKITEAERNGQKEFPFTMGQNQFDFIDYEDFCEQVARAVTLGTVTQSPTNDKAEDKIKDKVIEGIINICSGHPEKLADRVERFIKENHYKIKLKYGAFPDRPYDSKAVWGNKTVL